MTYSEMLDLLPSLDDRAIMSQMSRLDSEIGYLKHVHKVDGVNDDQHKYWLILEDMRSALMNFLNVSNREEWDIITAG